MSDQPECSDERPTPAPESEKSYSHPEVEPPQRPTDDDPSPSNIDNNDSDTVNSSRAIEISLEAGNVDNSFYYTKWIKFNEFETPIVTQNENGPCPLIAIMNVLLLRRLLHLHESEEYTNTTSLMKHIGHHLINRVPKEFSSDEDKLNYEHNISDAFSVICKLQSGIDVNIGFSSVTSYELTPEIVIFDLLGIKLYHGWLVDPQDKNLYSVLENKTYNKAVEVALDANSPESFVVKDFLEDTSNQLTYHGLFELTAALKESEVAVLFRNNHFSTITKREGIVYQLVTDQGFVKEDSVVWEALSSVSGDNEFVNSFFRKTSHLRARTPERDNNTSSKISSNEPVDEDFELALQLDKSEQCKNDEQLARTLQEAENVAQNRSDDDHSAMVQRGEQNQRTTRRPSACRRRGSNQSQNGSDNRNCIIL